MASASIDGSLSKCCSTLFLQLDAPNGPANQVKNEVARQTFMNALRSGSNTAGHGELFNTIRGHWGKQDPYSGTNATVKAWVNVPNCIEATDIVSSLCASGDEPAERRKQIDVKIEDGAERKGQFSPDLMDSICRESGNEILAGELAGAALNILKERNKRMMVKAETLAGNYANGTDSRTTRRTAKILNNTGGLSAQPFGFTTITREFDRQNIIGQPILVGGYKLQDYMIATNVAGFGAQSVNANNVNYTLGIEWYFDPSVNPVLNDAKSTSAKDYALAWAPGAIQYIEHYDFFQYAHQGADSRRIVLSIGGEDFDFFVKWDDCNSVYKWILRKRFDLFYYPDSLYTTCGAEWNQKLLFELGCGALDCTYDDSES